MAPEAKVAQEVTIDIEKELRAAELRIMEFEASIQSGEADEYDETEIAKRAFNRTQARKLLKTRGDVVDVIGRVSGRRMLYRILEIAGPNRLSPNISDPYLTAEANGKRLIANAILEMLYDADPNVYAQMQREHVSDLKSELERKHLKDMESES